MVDYGEEHSRVNGHHRFGLRYSPGQIPHWDADHPVHLIGHSFGATTAIELYQLLVRDTFGLGTDHRWVSSITSIAGPLSGSTLVHWLGFLHIDNFEQNQHIVAQSPTCPSATRSKPRAQSSICSFGSIGHILFLCVGLFFKAQHHLPCLNKLYDLRMNQWRDYTGWHEILSSNRHPISTSRDNVFHCMMPRLRMVKNASLVDMDKIYLFSIVCDQTVDEPEKPKPKQRSLRVPMVATMVLLAFGCRKFGAVSRKHLWIQWWWTKRKWRTRPSGTSFMMMMMMIAVVVVGTTVVSTWMTVPNHTKIQRPQKSKRKSSALDLAHSRIFSILSWLLDRHSRQLPKDVYSGTEASHWSQTDGVVNTYSMLYPRVLRLPLVLEEEEEAQAEAETEANNSSSALGRVLSHQSVNNLDSEDQHTGSHGYIRGQWYTYRVKKNHFIGTAGDHSADRLYHALFRLLNRAT